MHRYFEHVSITLFNGLPSSAKEDLLFSLPHRKYKKNQILYLHQEHGDVFFILLKGHIIQYTYTDDLQKSVFELPELGECLGESSLFHLPYQEYAEVRSREAIIAVCDRERWLSWKQLYPQIHNNLDAILCEKINFYKNRILQGREELCGRLMMYINYSIRKRGIDKQGEIHIPRILSQDEIASFIHGSRQTVSILLGQLKKEQKIDFSRDWIIVKPKFFEK